MKHEYFADYGRVQLRPLTRADAEKLRLLRNRNRGWFLDASEIRAEAQETWYQQYLSRPGDYMFSIYHQPSGRWAGVAAIYRVERNVSAEFGRLLIDHGAVAERGLGTDATKAACSFAFRQLGLKRLKLEVYHDNAAALITYLKAGFLPVCLKECGDSRKLLYMEAFPEPES